MEKMTSLDFDNTMNLFLKILENQPNLLHARHVSTVSGEEIADMAVAFIDRIHKAREERGG